MNILAMRAWKIRLLMDFLAPFFVEKHPCVYILASGYNGTLYIGVTTMLFKRMMEHTEGIFEGFSKKYHIHHLVYYEFHFSVNMAIQCEKRLKNWNRNWKIRLIEQMNPQWHNLFDPQTGILDAGPGGQLPR